MKSFKVVLFFVLFILTSLSVMAQDKSIILSGNVTKFSVDVVDDISEYAQGFGIQGTFKFLGTKDTKANGLRVRGVLDFQRNNVEVFHDYMIPGQVPTFVDIYRDVNTYSAGAQLGLKIGPVEPFATYLLGAEKRHENLDWELARTVQAGANLYLGSHFVLQPFRAQFKGNGRKPLELFGFSVGAGFRF
jgi:hypothetical protein